METDESIDCATSAEAFCPTPAGCGDKGLAEVGDSAAEDELEGLKAAIVRVPRHRGLFLRLLGFCHNRKELGDVEREVASYPEFAAAAQTPYHLIMTMVDHGGLRWIELDVQGVEITAERKEGLTEDEADDLIDHFAVQTTDLGEKAEAELAPEKRMRSIFSMVPARMTAFLDVIDFCNVPRTFKEVDALLRGSEALRAGVLAGQQPLQSSYYLDMLERAGGLVWKDGWKATEEGTRLVKALRA